jgi:hypothetical protein
VKAVALATAGTILYFLAVTMAFRLCPPDTLRARLMLRLFLLTAAAGVVVHLLTPADLGFLPAGWVEPGQLLDLAFFLFLYSAAFFGGTLQLYNLADRGFSLRIVIDMVESKSGYMSVGDVLTSYSAGQGIPWMYQKRLDDLVRINFLTIGQGQVVSTAAGRRVAQRFQFLRRFLRLAA